MRIKNTYSVRTTPQLVSLLEQLGISYKVLELFQPALVQFRLYDDDIRKKEIEAQLTDQRLIIPEAIFTKSEYEEATWYRFMPKYDKILTSDSTLTYSFFCKNSDKTTNYDSIHKHQIGYHRLSKSPRWPKEICILSGEGNYNQRWFTNNATRALLESTDISGLRFDPVLSEKNDQQIADAWQIVFENTLPEDSLVLGKEYGIRSVVTCENCGEKRYIVCPHTYQLHLYDEYLNDQDIYMTQAAFGEGYGYHIVIGSKKFYLFLKETALDKYFNIHPIKTMKNECNRGWLA